MSEELEKQIEGLSKDEKIVMLKKLEIAETMRYFAEECHLNTRGEKMTFDDFMHMVDLFDYGAFHDKEVLLSGTQIGKSTLVVIYALACAACGLNVMFMFPQRLAQTSSGQLYNFPLLEPPPTPLNWESYKIES